MKFIVENNRKLTPRLGQLKDVFGKPDVVLNTPLVQLHTQGGQIPHITHEVFKIVSKEPQILQIPLVSMHIFKKTMEYYDGTLSEFIGSKNSITCMTLHDPSNLCIQGFHAKGKVPIWTKEGKILYDPASFMDMVESCKPDMYCFLSDGDTNRTSSTKRLAKSVENTAFFYKKCFERHKTSDILKNAFVLAPIVGGYCLKSREKCLETLQPYLNDVHGFLIDGLHNNGPEVEFLPFEEVQPIVQAVVENIPDDGLRIVQGCWNPVNIIKMVKLGVDVFDTSYCRILTERSAALTFAINLEERTNSFELNLRNARFAEDFSPILPSCRCLTCSKYSRGYIHHLLTVQELLGPVLIMIHNIHHYLRFFEQIRNSIADGSLDELENKIGDQFGVYQQNFRNDEPTTVNLNREEELQNVQ